MWYVYTLQRKGNWIDTLKNKKIKSEIKNFTFKFWI